MIHYYLFRFFNHQITTRNGRYELDSVDFELIGEVKDPDDEDYLLNYYKQKVTHRDPSSEYILVEFVDDTPLNSCKAIVFGIDDDSAMVDCVEHDLRVTVSVAFGINDNILE